MPLPQIPPGRGMFPGTPPKECSFGALPLKIKIEKIDSLA
jgi:hypothetical protein